MNMEEVRGYDLFVAAKSVLDRWYKDGSILASEMADLEREVDAYEEALNYEWE